MSKWEESKLWEQVKSINKGNPRFFNLDDYKKNDYKNDPKNYRKRQDELEHLEFGYRTQDEIDLKDIEVNYKGIVTESPKGKENEYVYDQEVLIDIFMNHGGNYASTNNDYWLTMLKRYKDLTKDSRENVQIDFISDYTDSPNHYFLTIQKKDGSCSYVKIEKSKWKAGWISPILFK